jgi:ribosomal protein S18 acetylase RimI-like enzyme
MLVARLAGRPVGCGVLKRTGPGVIDIKRMWVDPSLRGRGLGRRLLGRLVHEAGAFEVDEVRLETNRALVEAIALYRAEGFIEVEPFNDEPHAHHWFSRKLP